MTNTCNNIVEITFYKKKNFEYFIKLIEESEKNGFMKVLMPLIDYTGELIDYDEELSIRTWGVYNDLNNIYIINSDNNKLQVKFECSSIDYPPIRFYDFLKERKYIKNISWMYEEPVKKIKGSLDIDDEDLYDFDFQ